MNRWNVNDLYVWLLCVADCELSEWALQFKINNVDGQQFIHLTDEELMKLLHDDEYVLARCKLFRVAQLDLDERRQEEQMLNTPH